MKDEFKLRYYWLFVMIFFACDLAQAQLDLQFSGYVVDLPIYQSLNSTFAQLLDLKQHQALNLTRIRLRPSLSLWDGATLSLEHEVTALYQSASFQSLQVSFISRRQVVDLRWDPVREMRFSVAHFVDRLYVRQNFSRGRLIVGRQRVSWGTGRIWNPTDLFNPINPASFDKIEKDGADAVSFKYYFGNFTDLELVYNPEDEFRRWNAGLRFRTNYAEYDVSLMGGYFDKRVVAGADFAGNLFKAGFRGEGIFSAEKNDASGNFVKFILGLDYQFTSKLYTLIEYQFNGEGKTDRNKYEVARLFKGEILNLSQNYLAMNATYQIHPLVSTSVAVNVNLNDGSGFVTPLASYSVTEDFYLYVGGLVVYGGVKEEYWYYPTSVFGKGEWYF